MKFKDIFGWSKNEKKKKFERDINAIKNGCKILFIDDEEFKFIERLKTQDQWQRITRIDDLESMSQPELVDAYIVFVDIYGVGRKMGFPNEGLGLMCAIKEKYPDKKVVMYSGESGGNVSAFDKAVNVVDRTLRKTATQYEFSTLIEEFATEAYSWNECVKRIQFILQNEFNISYEFDEVEKRMSRLMSEGSIDDSKIKRVFGVVDKVGSIASIISLFMSLG